MDGSVVTHSQFSVQWDDAILCNFGLNHYHYDHLYLTTMCNSLPSAVSNAKTVSLSFAISYYYIQHSYLVKYQYLCQYILIYL